MVHEDYYWIAWAIYSVTALLFLLAFYWLIKNIKFTYFRNILFSLVAAILLLPMDNSGQIAAIAPTIMMIGLSGMDNIFMQAPQWQLTIDALWWLANGSLIATLSSILATFTYLKLSEQHKLRKKQAD